MERAESDCAARYRTALQCERAAWSCVEGPARAPSAQRTEQVDAWLAAHRRYLDAQAELTAVTVHRATQSLRDSAALLFSPGDAALPAVGARFVDRDGVTWKVVLVVHDVFEPDYCLLQLAREGGRDPIPVDVLSEDWALYCLVHRLRACPGQ
jgi:hypothetical protein